MNLLSCAFVVVFTFIQLSLLLSVLPLNAFCGAEKRVAVKMKVAIKKRVTDIWPRRSILTEKNN